MIRAIETRYNGYRFRSRLEARWAVFFNGIGAAYRYETEGYDIDGVRYLPDFYLTDYRLWFEVKGPHATIDDLGKPLLFAEAGKPILVLTGDAWYETSGYAFGLGIDDYSIKITPCPSCDGLGVLFSQVYVCLRCFTGIQTSEIRLSQKWYDAYVAARQARFEHRQEP